MCGCGFVFIHVSSSNWDDWLYRLITFDSKGSHKE